MHTHPLLIKSYLEAQIQSGIKTQTRRLTGLDKINQEPDHWLHVMTGAKAVENHKNVLAYFVENATHDEREQMVVKYPYGLIDSLLWCKNSYYVKKSEAETWMRITGIEYERLQDISEADAIAEGVELSGWNNNYKDYTNPKSVGFVCAKQSFKSLIDVIHGPDVWRQNPWVSVTHFEYLPGFSFANIKQ